MLLCAHERKANRSLPIAVRALRSIAAPEIIG
jgi:hypothetical protein